MRKFTAVFLCVMMIVTSAMYPVSASADENTDRDAFDTDTSVAYYEGGNINSQNYGYYAASKINSYLTDCGDGTIMKFQNSDSNDKYWAEYYDSEYNSLRSISIEKELPIFGGFYSTDKYYILVTGQLNSEESTEAEVFRITEYDKDWNRISSDSLFGANTTIPFRSGSLRMNQCGDYLLIRTSHQMFVSDDGKNHQANVTIEFDTAKCMITDSFTKVANSGYGYVSHSFNQFIRVEDNKIVAVDHGDAYPRSVVLIKYKTDVTGGTFTPSYSNTCSVTDVIEIPGVTGDNYTGVGVGGFEISDSSYIIAGDIVTDWDNLSNRYAARNIYTASVSKTSGEVTLNMITDYKDGDDGVTTPHLVKISDNRFILMWSVPEYTRTKGLKTDVVYYTEIDGNGKRVGDIYSMDGNLSDCVPTIIDNKIVWYVWKDRGTVFYEIDLSDISSHNSRLVYNGKKYEYLYEQETAGLIETGNCSKTSSVYTSGGEYLWNSSNNVRYSLYDNGSLYIYGTGAMASYSTSEDSEDISPFYGDERIKRVFVEPMVTNIGSAAFFNCTELTEANISLSVDSVDYYAFYDCSALENIDLPGSISKISMSAFQGCESLKSIDIPESVTSMGDSVFYNCSSLESVNLSDSIPKIGNNTFFGCTALKEIDIPDKVTQIGSYAFARSGLENIKIPEGVEDIEYCSFSRCSDLKNAVLPDSVKSIGDYAFYGCSALARVENSNGLTSIGSSAFYGCSALESIYIPNGLERIENYTFCGCESLKEIEIPDSIKSIGSRSFYGCGLEKVRIPSGTETIEDYAFYGCGSLGSVEIAESVESIGENVFNRCSVLSTVVFRGSLPEIAENSFYEVIAAGYYPDGDSSWSGVESGSWKGGTFTFVPLSSYGSGEKVVILSGYCNSDHSVQYYLYENGELYIFGEGKITNYFRSSSPFSNTNRIEQIHISEGVTGIESFSFQNYYGLQTADIPDSVTSMSSDSFYGCPEFTVVGYKCSAADTYASEHGLPFNALGHTSHLVTDEAVPASCTEDGLTEGTHCPVCGEVFVPQEIVSAFGHTVVKDEAVEATCTEDGLTEGSHCSVCGEILVEQKTVPAHGHTVVTDKAVEPTCTEDGLTEGLHCSVCGEVLVEQKTVPAHGHTVVTDKAVEPTCTEDGLTEGSHCSVCGEILVEQKIVPAHGHTVVTDKAIEPTCTEDGLTEGSHCSVCGEIIVEQKIVPAHGHTVVTDKAIDPTCTEDGLTEGSHCSVCGEVLVEQKTVPAHGHNYVNGICTFCGDIDISYYDSETDADTDSNNETDTETDTDTDSNINTDTDSMTDTDSESDTDTDISTDRDNVDTPDTPEKPESVVRTIGDLNDDGSINSADAVMVLRIISGLDTIPEEFRRIADVNGDGNISTYDAVQILRYMINLPTDTDIGTEIVFY